MRLFEKKRTIFQEKDKTTWMRAKLALREAGVKGVHAGSYEDEPPVCGCGSKLDPRDFGAHGKIDRRMYYIDVPDSIVEEAGAIVKRILAERETT